MSTKQDTTESDCFPLETNLLEDLDRQQRALIEAVVAGDKTKTAAAHAMFLHGVTVAEMATAYGHPQIAYAVHARTTHLTREIAPEFDAAAASILLRPANPSYRLN